jgi:hypothetical protein
MHEQTGTQNVSKGTKKFPWCCIYWQYKCTLFFGRQFDAASVEVMMWGSIVSTAS